MEHIRIILSAIGTFFIYILGGFDISLQFLLIVITLDYISGISKAYVTKKLNSNAGIKGIVKKLCLLILVTLATILDRLIGDSGLIRTSIIYYLIANEGLSIIENLGELDIIVPDFLKDKLEQIRKGDKK